MKKILITRRLIKSSEEYASKIFDVQLNDEDKLLTKDELITKSNDCDGILSSITEKLDEKDYFKTFRIKLKLFLILRLVLETLILMQHQKRNIIVTNTPDVLTDATAEIAMLVLLGAARRAERRNRMGK